MLRHTWNGVSCSLSYGASASSAMREISEQIKQRNVASTGAQVKWQGPVYTTQESQWDCPTWETSLSEYIAYVKAVDAADPDCKECNAEQCPRLYLNGWPAFSRLPWLREYVVNPTFVDDVSGQLIADNEELREAFISAVTKGYSQPSEEYRRKLIDDEYWELTKLFISPKGALTRLHFDNGGAHVWLSQVRGRKLFVCFPPSDGPHLHAFDGDEGLPNGSWIDPLDVDVLSKWPDYGNATPYVGVVEERARPSSRRRAGGTIPWASRTPRSRSCGTSIAPPTGRSTCAARTRRSRALWAPTYSSASPSSGSSQRRCCRVSRGRPFQS
ncbi:unnamed protein product [Prorocentrum cordatum]|uniref:Cupin-like domain-containing protein n=1 Tax=Prorocentrum cordatum TaxID=2364126 RepID=A0ABN9VB03_9DINO|nr:unnamed protein product [Polarella glacialis]